MTLPPLGSRGQGWVVLQFVLLGTLLLTTLLTWAFPWPGEIPVRAAGLIAVALGTGVALWAAAALGSALTPLPEPRGPSVVAAGPYRHVRHPIYSGLLLACIGVTLATTPWCLVPTGLLMIVWALKCRVEEGFLTQRFPDYPDYCRTVRWRLVPGVY